MQELWTSFGKSGTPAATRAGLSWPPHSGELTSGKTMILDLDSHVEPGVKARDCKVMLDVAKCGAPPPPPPPPPSLTDADKNAEAEAVWTPHPFQ